MAAFHNIETLTVGTTPTACYDVVLRAYVGLMDGHSVRVRYAVKKHQLANEELRRYQIQNITQ